MSDKGGSKKSKKNKAQEADTFEKHKRKRTTSSSGDDLSESSKKEFPNNSSKKKLKEEKLPDVVQNYKKEDTDDNITWPREDLAELIKCMEQVLPEKDSLAYSTRVEKLDWNNVVFKSYTAEECKRTWLMIQKRLRRFRLLSELLQDSKSWISKPWTNFYRGNKTKRHPDMPRRPLSIYMVFYMKKKDRILRENPGLEMPEVSKKIGEMYKNLSAAKKEKYALLVEKEKKVYEQKLEEFYCLHPEVSRDHDKVPKKEQIGPKKPSTPFTLFYEDRLKNTPRTLQGDYLNFKQQCKEQWNNLSDKKKVVWIKWALDSEAKYQDEVKSFTIQNPNFNPGPMKPILTKEERMLKERVDGKPVKPPNSAYSLFSRMMLQSEQIKHIAPKERLKAIADQWRECTEQEKVQYKQRAEHLMEQYKLDFASYLESLPEDKRQVELQNNLPKRKKSTSEASEDKAPSNSVNVPSEHRTLEQILQNEPAYPPGNAYQLFVTKHRGVEPVKAAWKNLSAAKKNEYNEKAATLKSKYIKAYQEFLENLSPAELKFFSKHRSKVPPVNEDKESSSEDSSDSSSSSSSSDSD